MRHMYFIMNTRRRLFHRWNKGGNAVICALIGACGSNHTDEWQLEEQLRTLIEQENVSAFVFGYFGSFENLLLRVAQRLQEDYPLLDYTVMLTGRKHEHPTMPGIDNLHAFYPQGIWLLPKRLGLSGKYRYLASAADAAAVFGDGTDSVSTQRLCQATRKKKLYHLALV